MACKLCFPGLLCFRLILLLIGGGGGTFPSPAFVGGGKGAEKPEGHLFFRISMMGGDVVTGGMYNRQKRSFYKNKNDKLRPPILTEYATTNAKLVTQNVSMSQLARNAYFTSFTRGKQQFETRLLPETRLIGGQRVPTNFKRGEFLNKKVFQYEIYWDVIGFRTVALSESQQGVSRSEGGNKDALFERAGEGEFFILEKWANANDGEEVITATKMKEYYEEVLLPRLEADKPKFPRQEKPAAAAVGSSTQSAAATNNNPLCYTFHSYAYYFPPLYPHVYPYVMAGHFPYHPQFHPHFPHLPPPLPRFPKTPDSAAPTDSVHYPTPYVGQPPLYYTFAMNVWYVCHVPGY